MQENRLVEALTRNSLCTYEFDVSADLVEEEIVTRSGVNFTKILGLIVPCSFDVMMERAFGGTLECRYTSGYSVTILSRQALLDAFEKGRTKLEANIYYAAWDKYVRITYLLSRTEERDVLSEENGELARAADAVHSILNEGSFVPVPMICRGI